MIDHVEAALALGVVDAANVDQATEAAIWIVAQKLKNRNKLLAVDLDAELAKGHLRGQDRGAEAICEISAELVKGVVHQSSRTRKSLSVRSCRSA